MEKKKKRKGKKNTGQEISLVFFFAHRHSQDAKLSTSWLKWKKKKEEEGDLARIISLCCW